MNYSELIKMNINKMNALIEKAKTEKRDLSDEEQTVFNSLELEVTSWKTAAERESRITNLRADLDKPVTVPPRVEVVKADDKFNTLGEYLFAVKNYFQPNQIIDNRLMTGRHTNIATGMGINVGEDGGFAVQPQFVSKLMESIMEESSVLSRIFTIPIGSDNNGISLPALAETSRADGSRWGGVRAYWGNEGSTVTVTRPKLRDIDLKLQKLMAFVYMTDELMRDASAMEAFVMKAYSNEMTFKIDDSIINGDGKGVPLGILNCPALVTVAKEAGQGADTIVSQNIIKMWSRMPSRSRKNAVWLINQEIETELFGLTVAVGAGGIPVYMPAGGISAAPYATLLGKPVIPVEQCSKLGDAGDIILVDLQDYIGITKGGLQSDSSIHVAFINDEQVFRFKYRFNGLPYTNSPIASKSNASFTLSPYVTLAAR